jgi:hypothetical protein
MRLAPEVAIHINGMVTGVSSNRDEAFNSAIMAVVMRIHLEYLVFISNMRNGGLKISWIYRQSLGFDYFTLAIHRE